MFTFTLLLPACDFTSDRNCNSGDVDDLYAQRNLIAGVAVADGNKYDLDGDNLIDENDLSQVLAGATTENGTIFPTDLAVRTILTLLRRPRGMLTPRTLTSWWIILIQPDKCTENNKWANGNFDGDDDVDISDIGALVTNFAVSGYEATNPVPESSSAKMYATGRLAAVIVFCQRKISRLCRTSPDYS